MIDVAKGRDIGMSKFVVGFNGGLSKFFSLETLPPRGENIEENEWEINPDKAF